MKRITQKIDKTKKKSKIKFFWLLAAIIIIAIILIRILPTVKSIDIKINLTQGDSVKVTKEEILELSGLKTGDRLYKNLRSEIEQKIEENSYIEDAKIYRKLNGKVTIEVKQRQTEYLVNFSGEYIYLDKEGYVLEVNSQNNGDKIIIIGLTTDFSALSIGNSNIRLNQEDLDRIETVNNIVDAIKSNDIENKIFSIDVTDKKDFILNFDEDKKSAHIGDGSNLNTRVLYIKKILETEKDNAGIIYINGDLEQSYAYFKEQ